MSVRDFLKDLPTRNSANFARLQPGSDDAGGARNRGGDQQQARSSSSAVSRHRSNIYVPTKDYPSDQVRLGGRMIRRAIQSYITMQPF